MPAKCLTFLFIRLTDSEQQIKTGRKRQRDEGKERKWKGENGRKRIKYRGVEREIGAEKERAVI